MQMGPPPLRPLELQIMDAFWKQGKLAIRERQKPFAGSGRPAYGTIPTTVYGMEERGAIRRIRKTGDTHIFSTPPDRQEVRGRLLDDLLRLFGGDTQPVMAHTASTGTFPPRDVREAERLAKEPGGKPGEE